MDAPTCAIADTRRWTRMSRAGPFGRAPAPGTQLGGARSYATERLSRPDTSSEWGWENFQKPKFTLDGRGGGCCKICVLVLGKKTNNARVGAVRSLLSFRGEMRFVKKEYRND